MHSTPTRRAFTLIELLTVIAIIALLVALLFPVLHTAQEQARATQCMTQLHNLYVAVGVYKSDENGYPAALLGWGERDTPRADGTNYIVDPTGADSDQVLGTGAAGQYRIKVTADGIINGFLYKEQIRSVNDFLCPDNKPIPDKGLITIAHFPPRPANWPSTGSYITDSGTPVATNCPSDSAGVIDCYTEGPYQGKPKYFYVWDSYDVAPRIGSDGKPVQVNGNTVYDLHYSTDWTGVTGANDLPSQLKYGNPPGDKTLLAYCTYHAAVAGSDTFPAITLGGTAKKVHFDEFIKWGPLVFNHP